MSDRALVVAASAVSAALVALYLALGGSGYEPTPVQDPCAPRPWREPDGIDQAAEQFTLSGLDGAACELRVTRETLALALSSESSRERFAREYGISDAEMEAAVRAGVERAIDDAEDAGALSPLVAAGLREVASRLPVDESIALIEDARGVFEDTQGLLDQAGGVLDQILP